MLQPRALLPWTTWMYRAPSQTRFVFLTTTPVPLFKLFEQNLVFSIFESTQASFPVLSSAPDALSLTLISRKCQMPVVVTFVKIRTKQKEISKLNFKDSKPPEIHPCLTTSPTGLQIWVLIISFSPFGSFLNTQCCRPSHIYHLLLKITKY